MKISKYNIYATTTKGVVCFNTYGNSFVLLPPDIYSSIINGSYADIDSGRLETLSRNHMLIEDDKDEFESLIKDHESALRNNKLYDITLLPSLDCNLRCWYCFEKHIKNSRLANPVQLSILRFVENLCKKAELEQINIELFGGEPLLYFEEELYPLLSNIKSLVEKYDKTVNYFFVTNATCIREEHLPLFKSLGADFQISIDGYREKHNTVKKIPGSKIDTYEKVMQVVRMLTDYYDVYINLRINYDNNTLNHIEEVIKDIIDIDPNKLSIHLEKVWQLTGSEDKQVRIKDVVRMIMANGFRVSYMNLFRKEYSCKAGKRNQAVISYNGDVYKCTGRDFTEHTREGRLQPDGIIKWEDAKLRKRLSIKTYDNEHCANCKLLPLCWGPCCQKLLETPDDVLRYCQLKHMDMSLEDYIIYRFNNKLTNKSS